MIVIACNNSKTKIGVSLERGTCSAALPRTGAAHGWLLLTRRRVERRTPADPALARKNRRWARPAFSCGARGGRRAAEGVCEASKRSGRADDWQDLKGGRDEVR
jgi:hypothetical protein